MNKSARILIVGKGDIVDRALAKHLRDDGYSHVDTTDELAINTTIQASVYAYFQRVRPEYVFLMPTKSGGIQANQQHPAEFLYHNLETQNNIFHAAVKFETKKALLYVSSCVYPKHASQPMKEDALLTGPLEPTSLPYAVSKIAGWAMAQAFHKQYGLNTVVMIPATVYGPGMETDPQEAHVLGALMTKFHEAKEKQDRVVTLWGSGNPRREFLHINDFVAAVLFLMARYHEPDVINVGVGQDVSIKELAENIKGVAGYDGAIQFDASKPDGAPQKLLDNTRMKQLGWSPSVSLDEGLKQTYQWYSSQVGAAR